MVAEMLINAEDELLEQAGLFVAEGDFAAALPLLEQIAESGDEQQKEMAEAYLLQISEMLPSENEFASPDFLIEDDFLIEEKDDETTVDVLIDGDSEAFFDIDDDGVTIDLSGENSTTIDFSEDFLHENNAVEGFPDKAEVVIESFDEEAVVLDFSKEENSEAELAESEALIEDILSAKYEYSDSVYVPRTSARVIANTLGGLQQHTKEVVKTDVEILPEPSNALQPVSELFTEEEPIVVEADLASAETFVSSGGSEADVALEQVEMLLGDIDLETAELLLATVLTHGTPIQKSKADSLLFKISQSTDKPSSTAQGEFEPNDKDIPETLSDNLLEKAAMLMAEGDNQGAKVLFERLAQSDDEVQREMANAYLLQLSELNRQVVGVVEHPITATFEDKGFIGSSDLLNPLDALHSDAEFIDLSSQVDVEVNIDEKEYRQGFYIGNVGLMIRYIDGSELTNMPKLYHLPNSPTWFLGVVNLHGLVVPVFDLAAYFGIDAGAIKKPKLLVLGQDEKATGIIIDGLPRRLSWGVEQKVGMNMVPDYLRPTIKAACLIEKALWFDLNINELMSSIEGSVM